MDRFDKPYVAYMSLRDYESLKAAAKLDDEEELNDTSDNVDPNVIEARRKMDKISDDISSMKGVLIDDMWYVCPGADE